MSARDPKGRFRPGASGNPKGREPGSRDRRSVLREMIAEHAETLIGKALDLARDGDAAAIRLLLDRAIAPLRPESTTVRLDLPENASLSEMSRAIMAAVSAGDIPPDTARGLLDALAAQARVIEVDELARRIEALEQAQPARKKR